ncbi:MAG: DUF86 domain-containing protein [Rubrivivax sp.]|nr:DUF86 domain-containing protein [Rubrivivax sp.]
MIFNLMILIEAASRLFAQHPGFVAQHPLVPRRNIKGMRNRIAHGYVELNLHLVWETVRSALPELVQQMPAIRASAAAFEPPPVAAAYSVAPEVPQRWADVPHTLTGCDSRSRHPAKHIHQLQILGARHWPTPASRSMRAVSRQGDRP